MSIQNLVLVCLVFCFALGRVSATEGPHVEGTITSRGLGCILGVLFCDDDITVSPSAIPTAIPTLRPIASPTQLPTCTPTHLPTFTPTQFPTFVPTHQPTFAPTKSPTSSPVATPTQGPTATTSQNPTARPTSRPTQVPSFQPTSGPTLADQPLPTVAPTPLFAPTPLPTSAPVLVTDDFLAPPPTLPPVVTPTDDYVTPEGPTGSPTRSPSLGPGQTGVPTFEPTGGPSPLNRRPTHRPTRSLSPTAAVLGMDVTVTVNDVALSGLDSADLSALRNAVISATAVTAQVSEEYFSAPSLNQVAAANDSPQAVEAEFTIIAPLQTIVEALVAANESSTIDTTSSLDDLANAFAAQLYIDEGSVLSDNLREAIVTLQNSGTTTRILFLEMSVSMRVQALEAGNVSITEKPIVVAFFVAGMPSSSPTAAANPGTASLSLGAIVGIAIIGAIVLLILCCVVSCMHEKTRRVTLSCLIFFGLLCGVDTCINKRDRSSRRDIDKIEYPSSSMAESPIFRMAMSFRSPISPSTHRDATSMMEIASDSGTNDIELVLSPGRTPQSPNRVDQSAHFSECSDVTDLELGLAISLVALKGGQTEMMDSCHYGGDYSDVEKENTISPWINASSHLYEMSSKYNSPSQRESSHMDSPTL
jgi:hypothetical protein